MICMKGRKMKIRNGFVSNSSSSSFIIGFSKGSTKKDIEKILKDKMRIGEGSILEGVSSNIISTIIKNMEKIKNIKKYIKEEYCGEDEGKLIKASETLDMYEGSFANDSDSVECFLCYQDFDINEKDFYFLNSGGY